MINFPNYAHTVCLLLLTFTFWDLSDGQNQKLKQSQSDNLPHRLPSKQNGFNENLSGKSRGGGAFNPFNDNLDVFDLSGTGEGHHHQQDDDDDFLGVYPDHKEDSDELDYNKSEYEDDGDLGPTLDDFGDAAGGGGDSSQSLPVFLIEPQNTYVIKNKPASLKCKAENALQLFFKCSGSGQPPPSIHESHVDPQTGVHVQEITAAITKQTIDEYFGKGPFKCECHAWSPRGTSTSQPAIIEVAYLKRQFKPLPETLRVRMGDRIEISCVPPNGEPTPEIKWLKNGFPVITSSTVTESDDGRIIISHASLQDMANYTCVAENIAGKRFSNPTSLTVFVDGGWSSWSAWTECKCHGKTIQGQKRLRTCTNPTPLNGGLTCSGPNSQRTQDCVSCADETEIVSLEDYGPKNGGRWSSWSEWSKCNSNCIKVRRRICNRGLTESIPNEDYDPTLCVGKDLQTSVCNGGDCSPDNDVDWPLFIGLSIMLVVFVALGAVIFRSIYNGRRVPKFSIANAEMQPMYFQDAEKKMVDVQQFNTVAKYYDYPNSSTNEYSNNSQMTTFPRSSSEHHYDVPNFATQ